MKNLLFSLSFLFCLSANAQNILTITVADSTKHEPVVGAAVQVEGTKIGNVTDVDGTTSLQNLPNGKAVLKITFVK